MANQSFEKPAHASWPTPMSYISAQHLLAIPANISAYGYLHKKSNSQLRNRWQIRFIVVYCGCIYYFKTSSSAQPQGAFSLKGYNRILRAEDEITPTAVFPFKIVHISEKKRVWYLSTASDEERRRWMAAIRGEIKHHCILMDAYKVTSFDDSDDSKSLYRILEKPVSISLSRDGGLEFISTDEDNGDFEYSEEDFDEDERRLPPPPVFERQDSLWFSSFNSTRRELHRSPRRNTSPSLSPKLSNNHTLSSQSSFTFSSLGPVPKHTNTELSTDTLVPTAMFFPTADTAVVESTLRRNHIEHGLYCVRQCSRGGQVLVVWDDVSQKLRNFKIFKNDSGCLWLDRKEEDARFSCLADLVFYYKHHILPNQKDLALHLPYQT
uniref:SH3 domain-binding protein 2-like n=1 Tax=Myxine glutinosa TaxID=7769 RepID=UPI00358F8FED